MVSSFAHLIMEESIKLIFLVIAGFSAGFVDAIAGGGGLIALPALLALGIPPKIALGTNKFIGISTTIASSFRYGMARSIAWRFVLPMVTLAFLASAFGAWVATITDPAVLRPIILAGLILVASYLIFKNRFGLKPTEQRLYHWIWPLLIGFGIGFYDGFFGPGTGTFLMMAFVILFGKELLFASANSRIVNFSTNLGALLLFTATGYVKFKYALPGAIASFIGGIAGASWALKKGSKAIRPVFIGVVWLLIAKLIWDFW